jgi:hypothetical protein
MITLTCLHPKVMLIVQKEQKLMRRICYSFISCDICPNWKSYTALHISLAALEVVQVYYSIPLSFFIHIKCILLDGLASMPDVSSLS